MTINNHEYSGAVKSYWYQPVMYQFAQSVQKNTIYRLTRHRIRATDDRIVNINLLVACWFRVNPHSTSIGISKIPIGNSMAERPQLSPAVSSLEACPTPAR